MKKNAASINDINFDQWMYAFRKKCFELGYSGLVCDWYFESDHEQGLKPGKAADNFIKEAIIPIKESPHGETYKEFLLNEVEYGGRDFVRDVLIHLENEGLIVAEWGRSGFRITDTKHNHVCYKMVSRKTWSKQIRQLEEWIWRGKGYLIKLDKKYTIEKHVKIPFGKYKGKSLHTTIEKDPFYFDWLLDNISEKTKEKYSIFFQSILDKKNSK